MGSKSLHETTFPKIRKYMSESDRAVTAEDIAQSIDMSVGGIKNVMQLMELFKMVQKVKRGRTQYYVLQGFSDEQIEAMLPPKKVAPTPRRRRYRSIPAPPTFDDSFMEEYLSAVRVEPSSSEGLTALSMIRFSQEERAEEVHPQDGDNLYDLGIGAPQEHATDDVGAEEVPRAPINVLPFATVKHLPKEVRLLNSGEARYLKDQLRTLRGFSLIEHFGTVFARFSALEYGRYGNVLYFSLGTNQWDYVKKVTIDRSISDLMVLPIVEKKRWSSWSQFLGGLKETRVKYGREEYDKIIDQFIESGHELVEITVENRTAIYVRNFLRNRISYRGLEEKVKASYVDEWIYLEKVE